MATSLYFRKIVEYIEPKSAEFFFFSPLEVKDKLGFHPPSTLGHPLLFGEVRCGVVIVPLNTGLMGHQ